MTKTKKQIEAELKKAVKVYFGRDKTTSTWRSAFDQGVMQALSWALGKGKPPTVGFELRLGRADGSRETS